MNNIIGFILMSIAQASNAICDAVIFTGYKNTKKRDFLWHCLKWIIDRTFLFFSGVYFGESILEYFIMLKVDFYYRVWHYTEGIIVFAASICFSFFLWQCCYKYVVKLIQRSRY